MNNKIKTNFQFYTIKIISACVIMFISHIVICQNTYFKKFNNKVTQNLLFSVSEDIIAVDLQGKIDFPNIANLGKGDSIVWAKKFHTGVSLDVDHQMIDTTKFFRSGISVALHKDTFYSGQIIVVPDGSDYKRNIFVSKMSTSGDTLGSWMISEDSLGFRLLYGADIAVFANKICISAVISFLDNDWRFISALLWFDMKGQLLDTSIISEGDAYNWSGLLKIGSDGNLYWLTLHNGTQDKNRYFYFQLNKFDKFLQQSNVWQSDKYSTSTVNPEMEFTMLKDGGFVITTKEIEKMFTMTIQRYDKNGELAWQYTFEDQIKSRKIKGTLELQNGDLLLYGYYHDYTFHIGSIYSYFIEAAPHLCRMSSKGDILWERTYIQFDTNYVDWAPSSNNSVSDVLELPDGSIYVGTLNPNIALKTDQNGCIEGSCKRYYELIP